MPRPSTFVRRRRSARGAFAAPGLNPDSRPELLAEVQSEPDEGPRMHLIEALAHIGREEAIPILAQRYGSEDDDCRWATLKAMAYIGSEEALAVVREQGLSDAEPYYRKVAQRILGP